ncbi:flp pilus assembly protein tadD [Vibrio ishigakensis]|uniref:Flp pilus assembly protein tadD n=1 Tax=Vibrio ishigakensis TaxID=1481914 RepID=A0A0B8P235_9VIBR|nr:flp pilus assembly protein tadD [Vibrio ishigakensis]
MNRLFRLMAIPLAFASLVGCQSVPEEEELSLQSMLRIGNYHGVIAHYRQRLEIEPDNYEAMEGIAHAYYQVGDVESASFYTHYLCEHDYSNQRVALLMGQVAADTGNDEKALSHYFDSLALGNNSAQVHNLIGISYSRLENFEPATTAFNQARIQGYDEVTIKNNLAVVYLAKSDYRSVVSILAPVSKQYPNNKTINANLALALSKLGRYEDARALLEGEYSDEDIHHILHQVRHEE